MSRGRTLTKKLDTFCGSRRDQEEGGELDSHEGETLFAGPGEIKRKEVSWTLMKKSDTFAGPGEIKRREVVLDPQVSPEEIMSREVGLGCGSWTSFASVVTQQLCYGHCPCDCSAQQLKEQLRSALTATQWGGDTALTLWLFWRRSTASSVFRVGARGRAFTLSPPYPPPPTPRPRPE